METLELSVFNGSEAYQAQFADTIQKMPFEDIGKFICNANWSPSIFKYVENIILKGGSVRSGMHRKNTNFEYTKIITLDIDGGCTLEEAKENFKEYKFAICTTRNHQRIKNQGKKSEQPACDRFRVILQLDHPITNEADFRATWTEAKNLWPFIDESCCDPARFYFKSNNEVCCGQGKNFPVTKALEMATNHNVTPSSEKGQLFPSTSNFISNGAQPGSWHKEFFKAASDLREQGYNFEEAFDLLTAATAKFDGSLDDEDKKCLDDVYKRNLKYNLRESAKEWEETVPLQDYAVPNIPTSLLPKPLEEIVTAIAKATETPPELALLMVLGALSRAVTGKFKIETEKGFYEWVVLYLMCVLLSGNRKTAVLNLAKAPLENWEGKKAAEMESEIKTAAIKRKNEEAHLRKLRNRIGGKKEDNADLQRQIEEIELNLTQIPYSPRLLATDITPERLATLMAEQNECIGLVSDEGGIFDTFGGRYSNGIPNLDLYLKAYDGSAVRVDRANGTTVHLKRPLITTALCPQPSILEALTKKPEFRSRGLVARFLYAAPFSPLGTRTGNVSVIPAEIIQNYERMITAILDFECPQTDGEATPIKLELEPEAYALWKDFWKQTEKKLGIDGEFELMSDWGSKLPGAVARIAALFHVAINSEQLDKKRLVSADSV